jgi:hypothetical protein
MPEDDDDFGPLLAMVVILTGVGDDRRFPGESDRKGVVVARSAI